MKPIDRMCPACTEIDLMTVKQVAEKLQCCTKTVRRLFRTGKLTGPAPFHPGPNAKIRIYAASVGALAAWRTRRICAGAHNGIGRGKGP